MSRCFPFPPPGYEKKPRSDYIDLLAKEKHKEKKCKKDKRDKEQREGQKRKDKDRSRDKHKEEKDEKEKHREKKRDKDRDRKNRTEDDKKTEERAKGHNEEKIGSGSWKAEEVKNPKIVKKFGTRIKDEGAAERLLENFAGSVQKGTENFGALIALEKERCNRNEMATNLIAQEPRRNDALGQAMEMDADKKIERKTMAKNRYEMLAKLIGKEQRKNDSMDRIVEKDAKKNVEAKEKVKDRYRMVENLLHKEQRRDDKLDQTVEKDADEKFEGKEKRDDAGKKIEEKEKIASREANVRKGDKHIHRGGEKRHKGKDKDRHKEKEKEEEKKRDKGERIHKEHDKPKGSGEMDCIDNLIIMPVAPQKTNEKCAGTDGTIKKRKDFEINGFLHEIDGLPNKLPRPSLAYHLHVENGRTLESYHVATGYSSIKLETTKYINAERVLETNECKVNGIEGPPPSTDNLRPLVALESSPNGKASVKPPHPDTKFLGQIYSVPKMEEWPEYDDQYWLFSSNPPGPKPRATFEAEETSHVWAKGLQIESADVFALPFVIPY
ncbi:uncharacterized protein [Elaeis guineensis]|uniref:uncharacterized protein isoform X1 n=1 Tax=Elaeis guineensis var. tenera TaxID=51953 RepID=UPI003C6D4CC0